MAASAERRERELPAPRTRSTKTSLQGLPSHLRDWDSAAARLALEGCSEIVRKADRGALHTRILASPGRDRGYPGSGPGNPPIMELGGSLIADRSGDAPPYHCHLSGLTPGQLESILEPPERNPVPVHRRWMPR